MAGPRVLFSLNNVRAVKESLITPPAEEKEEQSSQFHLHGISLLALEAIGGKMTRRGSQIVKGGR